MERHITLVHFWLSNSVFMPRL